MEYHFLSRQICTLIIFRECEVQVFFLSHVHSHNAVLKTVDEGAASQGQVKALRSPAGKGLAVLGPYVVNIGHIAQFSCTSGDLRRILSLQVFQLRLQVLVGHSSLHGRKGQTLIISQLQAGLILRFCFTRGSPALLASRRLSGRCRRCLFIRTSALASRHDHGCHGDHKTGCYKFSFYHFSQFLSWLFSRFYHKQKGK